MVSSQFETHLGHGPIKIDGVVPFDSPHPFTVMIFREVRSLPTSSFPGKLFMSKQPAVIYDEKAQRVADEMIAAEERCIARRMAYEQQCDCKDGMFPRAGMTDRRNFLFA